MTDRRSALLLLSTYHLPILGMWGGEANEKTKLRPFQSSVRGTVQRPGGEVRLQDFSANLLPCVMSCTGMPCVCANCNVRFESGWQYPSEEPFHWRACGRRGGREEVPHVTQV